MSSMAPSLFTVLNRAARATERANKAQIRAAEKQARLEQQLEKTSNREAERAERDAIKARKVEQREEQRAYLEKREAQVEEGNVALAAAYRELENLLQTTFSRRVALDWQSLHRTVDESDFGSQPQAPDKSSFRVSRPGVFGRAIPGWKARHDKKLEQAKSSYLAAHAAYQDAEESRRQAVAMASTEVAARNNSITQFREAYLAKVPEAVCALVEIAFEKSRFPDAFSQKWKTAFMPESRQLVADINLPSLLDVIPLAEKFRYNKHSDEIIESEKPEKERQALYLSVVAQTVLRRLYEIYGVDVEQIIDVVAINAFVDAIDPATGLQIRPCLVSVRTTRNDFTAIDLRRVNPVACLKKLNASVSRSPGEMAAVKPIVDINMSDPRFVPGTDVLSSLDSRPNLMELTPGEFENLITNLFARMGLETKLTQASRDGGVDCVAFDPRPVLGGKVVIQAKRYKNTVGVSAVRDLFGTMHNEGASKGIIVTTSGYGKAAFDFANGKPLELLSGSNLLYLLKEHAGVDAKIIMPDDWVDAHADT
jgi:restriction system protein